MTLPAFRRAALAALLPLLAACAAGGTASQAGDVVAAVIVQPKQPSGAEVVLKTVREVLGEAARVRHVRLLAGDAHLLHLVSPATRDRVPGMIDRLRASGEFRYVELDSPMKVQ
jgi:hypothetical protein